MTTGRDDDALTWDGDDDPTLDVGGSAAAGDEPAPYASEPAQHDDATAASTPVELPEGFTAVGRGSDAVASAPAEGEASRTADASTDDAMTAERGPMGNGALVALGVLGGVYALYAVGWLIGGLRLQRTLFLNDAMFTASLWLATLSPLLWFATVYLLTRSSRGWIRFAWLVAGAVLLVPWPFIVQGVVGP